MKTIQKKKSYLGFTLVELIVVITILVILGTIAFMNLGGFAGSARDSARISNLANLQKGLNLYQVKTGTYPTPESSVAITASGVTIGYQGFAKDIVGGIAKISKGGTVDPSDSNIYTTYAVNQTLTKMQAMVFLEDSGNVTAYEEIPPTPLTKGGIIAFFNPLSKGVTSEASWGIPGIDTAYAATTTDYSKRFPKTSGDTLGILLSTATGTLNQPVQESGTGVDIILTNTGYLAVFSKSDSVSGTGGTIFTNIYNRNNELINNKTFASLDPSLVGYWDMETMSGSKLKDLSGKGNDAYLSGALVAGKEKGVIGQAIRFGNTTDFLEIKDTASVRLVNNFTINSFINLQGLNGGNVNPVLVKGNLLTNRGYYLNVNNNATGRGVVTSSTGTTYFLATDEQLALNRWYMLSLVKTGRTTTLFLNGTKIRSVDIDNDTAITNTDSLFIGHNIWSASSDIFNGSIDEVRIYNRALSDSEISALYNATK